MNTALHKFMLGFEGTSVPRELTELLAKGLAGVAIYPRNFNGIKELAALTDEIRRAAGRPVVIGIDQEGGTRFSLPEPFTPWPSPAELGRLNDPRAVQRIARAMARELRAAGVNLNFAPMLDLHVNPDSPVTQTRSYGADPERVGRLGRAFAKGMLREGIFSCAKHFPGHGDTTTDPHLDLPVFGGTMERLRKAELVPFRLVRNDVHMMMTAHILLPQIDPERPASLSPALLKGVLRGQLHFHGIILADDLGMGAIARRYGPGEAAVASFQAGTDIALLCHDWPAVRPALSAVESALARGAFDTEEWQASRARVEFLREALETMEKSGRASPRFPGGASLHLVGCNEHRRLAEEIRARAAAAGG